MKNAFKVLLHKACLDELEKRVSTIMASLNMLQDSKKNETKSSAGDKYETGRAMIQQEEAQLQKQLANNQRMLLEIKMLNALKGSRQIEHGSLIETNKGIFYLSSSLGKIVVEDQEVYCLSSGSPIGRLLLNKKVSDEFSFNGTEYNIKSFL